MDINHLIVIVFLIFCSTIIAICSIIYDYKNARKIEESNEHYLSKRITKVHRNYIIGFLSFGIISLITSLYGGDSKSNIFTYISFASTITSFVLSILAIFVTMQSNSGLEKQLVKIDAATNSISKLSENLDSTLSQVNSVSGNIEKSTQSLLEASKNILPQLKETLDSSLSHHEEKIVQEINKQNTPNEKATSEENSGISEEDLKNIFLSVISPNGLAAIYTCTLSSEQKKPFKRDEIFQSQADYNYGIIIATVSVGFLDISTEDGNEISCTNSRFTSEQVFAYIKQRINQSQLGSSYLELINQLRAFFNLPEVKVEIKDEEK